MSAYAVSITTPPEGGARGSHLPAHVGRGAGDLSQAWSSQIRRSGDLRPSFAAVDGPLRRLRERDGANVRRSGITLITLGYNVRRYMYVNSGARIKASAVGAKSEEPYSRILQDSSSGRSAAPSPSTTRKVQTHQVLSTPTRTTPSGPRVTTGRYFEASDLARVAGIMPRVCKYMGHHGTLRETYHLSSSRTVESRPREDQQSSVVDRASSSQAYGRHHYRRWSRSQRDTG